MPIKDLHCNKCGKDFEMRFVTASQFDRAFQQNLVRCTSCGSNAITKLVSRTARPQFKGRGFHETDYK